MVRKLTLYSWVIVTVLAIIGCELPSNSEIEFASVEISRPAGIKQSTVERTDDSVFSVFASDTHRAFVEFEDGATLRFERVGYNSFGPNATNLVVSEAGGLVPRIASCSEISFPNFHRDAPLGHHFSPSLIDVRDAVTRSGDVLEEIQYWPQCPMSWEVQDKRGVNYRYCAHKKDAPADPPRPSGCATP